MHVPLQVSFLKCRYQKDWRYNPSPAVRTGSGTYQSVSLVYLLFGERHRKIVDKGRNMIILYIQFPTSRTTRTMVAHDYKNGTPEPWFCSCKTQKFSNGKIRILNSSFPTRSGGNINFTFRIGIGLVVGSGHYKIEKRLARFVGLIGFLDVPCYKYLHRKRPMHFQR